MNHSLRTEIKFRKQAWGTFVQIFFLNLIAISAHSQEITKPISALQAFEIILTSRDTIADLSEAVILNDGGDIAQLLIAKYKGNSLLRLKDGRIVINKQIKLPSANLKVEGFLFEKEVRIEPSNNENYKFPKNIGENSTFNNCVFKNDLFVGGEKVSFSNVVLEANLFCNSAELFGTKIISQDAVNYFPSEEGSITLFENIFLDTLLIDGKLKSLEIFNNEFKGDLDLSLAEPLARFYLQRNKVFGKIVFSEFNLPNNSVLHWDFMPQQLAYALPEKNDSTVWSKMYGNNKRFYVSADNPMIFESQFLFLGLNALHNKFYNYFLMRGDIESANACYIEMKNIETSYYRNSFLKHGGYQNFLRWSLNLIIRVYTAYGTDPSLAILGSTYVILFFAIIFFFFPSEWDTTSHLLLKNHFSELRLKMENKDRVKRVFMLFRDLSAAIFIAITLSLNSFITIGFGNIPTRGVSRYACILEGTLGWFLLTLFSVALISQLL